MRNKIETISKGFDYLEANEKEPLELIRNPKYKRKYLGIEARILNHWDKMDLLLKKNVNGAMYTFSLGESFWIKIIQKLRAYNLPLEIIKDLKEVLNAPYDANQNSKLDDDFLEFLKHKDGTINISDFEKLLKSPEFLDLLQKMKITQLENILPVSYTHLTLPTT
jgi:DNA-binding transcriptional MerR regulator